MKRVLLTWEFGANLGHLSRDAAIARACLEADYEVQWAVADPALARRYLGDIADVLFQAPTIRTTGGYVDVPISFSDLLLQAGFCDSIALGRAVSQWLELLRAVRPAVVVYNFSPTALIAARILQIPTLIVGTPFEIPPSVTPMPALRPWTNPSAASLASKEARVLDAINSLLDSHRTARVNVVAELFETSLHCLTTFEELEPFTARVRKVYLGPPPTLCGGLSVDWPHPTRRHVFAYLRAGVWGCQELLAALNALDADVICVMLQFESNWPSKFARIRFVAQPVDLTSFLADADLVVCSGANTIANAISVGVPVLAVPENLEQKLAGLQLEQCGAGLVVRGQRTKADFKTMLHQGLNAPRYLAAARRIAAKYGQRSSTYWCGAIVDALKEVVERSERRSD